MMMRPENLDGQEKNTSESKFQILIIMYRQDLNYDI